MKPVYLKFTDNEGNVTKTFTTCSLKTGMMDNIFDIAEKAEEHGKGKLNIKQARQFFNDLKAIIVEVFGKQFTYDELNANVEQEEVTKVFNDLCRNVTGEISKN